MLPPRPSRDQASALCRTVRMSKHIRYIWVRPSDLQVLPASSLLLTRILLLSVDDRLKIWQAETETQFATEEAVRTLDVSAWMTSRCPDVSLCKRPLPSVKHAAILQIEFPLTFVMPCALSSFFHKCHGSGHRGSHGSKCNHLMLHRGILDGRHIGAWLQAIGADAETQKIFEKENIHCIHDLLKVTPCFRCAPPCAQPYDDATTLAVYGVCIFWGLFALAHKTIPCK